MTIANNIDKIQNLASAVSNPKIIIAADLFKLFKKMKMKGSGLALTNNKIKDIIKVIKPLGNKTILLKGTTKKITSQEGGFLNFLTPLITTGLPLMKKAHTPSA